MALRLRRGLERTVLGISSALIIASSSMCLPYKSYAQNTPPPPNTFLQIEEYGKYAKIKYMFPFSGKEMKKINFKAKKDVSPDHLDYVEIYMEMDDNLTDEQAIKEPAQTLTHLDPLGTRLTIFYPKKAELDKIEQEAYFLPSGKTEKLGSLEKSKTGKFVTKIAGRIIDRVLSLGGVIEPRQDLLDYSESKGAEKNSKTAKELEEMLGEKYLFEDIEIFTKRKLGNAYERKRKMNLYFNTKEMEEVRFFLAVLVPGVVRSDINGTTRASGGEVQIQFLLQGEKLPSWIEKQKLGPELIGNQEKLKWVLSQRKEMNIGVYDSQNKKCTIYSVNKEILSKSENKEKKALKEISLFFGVGRDMMGEKFSNKTKVFIYDSGKMDYEDDLYSFYDECGRRSFNGMR